MVTLFLPPCFLGFGACKAEEPPQGGLFIRDRSQKNRIRESSSLQGTERFKRHTFARPDLSVCRRPCPCHDPPRDPSGDFLAQSRCALSFGEFRSGEMVSRDGMSCGEFENGVRPGRRRSARCYGRDESARKRFWKVASGE